LSAVEIQLTEMQENLAQKTLVNATLHLIFGDMFQKANTQNLKYQCISFLCRAQHIAVNFFLCIEVHKAKSSGNPEK